MADPAIASDPDRCRELGKRYAALGPTVAAHHAWRRRTRRPRGGPRAGRRGPGVRRGAPGARGEPRPPPRTGCAACWSRATPTTTATSSSRSRRGRAARSRRCSPATCCGCTCGYAERRGLEHRGARRHRDRPRRLQGRAGRASRRAATPQPGEGPWARLKYEGGVHRVQRVPVTETPGPHPHLRRRRLGDARGRGGRGRDRPQRPAHRRLPLLRARRPERQHHRLRGADHPPAHRHRRVLPEREVASCRTARPRCACCAPGCTRWRWTQRRRRRRRRARAARCAPSTARERIRTYNFPENRISDHRTGFKAYNLDTVLDGDLDAVVQSAWTPTRPPASPRSAE